MRRMGNISVKIPCAGVGRSPKVYPPDKPHIINQQTSKGGVGMAESVIEQAVHPRLGRLAEEMPPPWRGELAALLNVCGCAEELRLRVGSPLALRDGQAWLRGRMPVTQLCLEDLLTHFCEGALYAHRESLCQGYVTLRDGCRVGVCGRATVEEGRITGICDVSSLCLRLPGALPPSAANAAGEIVSLLDAEQGCRSILICAPPGRGRRLCFAPSRSRLTRPPVRVKLPLSTAGAS